MTAIGDIGMTPVAHQIPGFDVIHTLVLMRILRAMRSVRRSNILYIAATRAFSGALECLFLPIVVFSIQTKCAQTFWSEAYPELFGDFTKCLSSMFMVWTLNATKVEAVIEDNPQAVAFFAFFYILELVFLSMFLAVGQDRMTDCEPQEEESVYVEYVEAP